MEKGFLEVVRAVLNWDPNLDWVDDTWSENNLLHLAAKNHHVRICEELYRSHPKLLEMKNSYSCTPLLAVLEQIGDRVREVEFDAEFSHSHTDSREAAEELDSTYAKVVQKLLELGAKLECKNYDSINAMGFVGMIGLPKIGRLIAQKLKGNEDYVDIINNANDSGLVRDQIVHFEYVSYASPNFNCRQHCTVPALLATTRWSRYFWRQGRRPGRRMKKEAR